jgi:outer membrane protein assembly factor BamD (BamD/ComL family)
MKTKGIRKAAQRYQTNRKNHPAVPWNKQVDSDNLFTAMQTSLYASNN